MSLVKTPQMTESKLHANRSNGCLSQGPATAAGRERVGVAHLRHGRYVDSQDAALRCLGEDPAEYEDLLERLYREFAPAGVLQERLLNRLARVLWLMDRSDRRHEGDTLLRAKAVDIGRENRMHARMMRLKMTAETLRSLARSVACWHYVTVREDLETMKKLHEEGVTTEMGEIALGLFYQLQEPGTDENGESEDDKARRVVNSVRSMFGIGPMDADVGLLTPKGKLLVVPAEPPEERSLPVEEDEESEIDSRYPKITEDHWRARERARKLLRNILIRQADVCEDQRKNLLKESLAGLSPYERAAETGIGTKDALIQRRIQDANFWEVRRLTNLLLKIKRGERPRRPVEASDRCADRTPEAKHGDL